jgi:hypothetical protein
VKNRMVPRMTTFKSRSWIVLAARYCPQQPTALVAVLRSASSRTIAA